MGALDAMRFTGEIPIAELEIVERFPDGTAIRTFGRGRLQLTGEDLSRMEVRWFEHNGCTFTRQLNHLESP